MGGKSDAPTPPAYTPMPDTSAQDAMMQQFMMQLTGLQGQMANMQTPQLPQMPEIEREPLVNWAEKNKELLNKAKGDYGVDIARRKGRSDTILTSPLLDEEDATTTTSIIT